MPSQHAPPANRTAFLLTHAVQILNARCTGGATPLETAAVGAVLCFAVAIVIYKLWGVRKIWMILNDGTKESVMILFITAAAGVFSHMLSSLFIAQSITTEIGTLDVNPWVLMIAVNIFLIIAGFFLPPLP